MIVERREENNTKNIKVKRGTSKCTHPVPASIAIEL